MGNGGSQGEEALIKTKTSIIKLQRLLTSADRNVRVAHEALRQSVRQSRVFNKDDTAVRNLASLRVHKNQVQTMVGALQDFDRKLRLAVAMNEGTVAMGEAIQAIRRAVPEVKEVQGLQTDTEQVMVTMDSAISMMDVISDSVANPGSMTEQSTITQEIEAIKSELALEVRGQLADVPSASLRHLDSPANALLEDERKAD